MESCDGDSLASIQQRVGEDGVIRRVAIPWCQSMLCMENGEREGESKGGREGGRERGRGGGRERGREGGREGEKEGGREKDRQR